MSVAQSIIDAVKVTRQTSASMLEHYYNEGVISSNDLRHYTDYLVSLNEALEYNLSAIFGVCEARLQTKGIK